MAAWKIGQRLWMRDYAGVHEAIRGFNWSPDTRDLVAAFSGECAPLCVGHKTQFDVSAQSYPLA